jgi:hypothetical protein
MLEVTTKYHIYPALQEKSSALQPETLDNQQVV